MKRKRKVGQGGPLQGLAPLPGNVSQAADWTLDCGFPLWHHLTCRGDRSNRQPTAGLNVQQSVDALCCIIPMQHRNIPGDVSRHDTGLRHLSDALERLAGVRG